MAAAETQCEVLDIEFDERKCVDVDVVYRGRIIPLEEIQEAKQRLLREDKDAEHQAKAETYKT
jgi:hypothetical protein